MSAKKQFLFSSVGKINHVLWIYIIVCCRRCMGNDKKRKNKEFGRGYYSENQRKN